VTCGASLASSAAVKVSAGRSIGVATVPRRSA
jgi:hypothetical protein